MNSERKEVLTIVIPIWFLWGFIVASHDWSDPSIYKFFESMEQLYLQKDMVTIVAHDFSYFFIYYLFVLPSISALFIVSLFAIILDFRGCRLDESCVCLSHRVFNIFFSSRSEIERKFKQFFILVYLGLGMFSIFFGQHAVPEYIKYHAQSYGYDYCGNKQQWNRSGPYFSSYELVFELGKCQKQVFH